MSYTPTNWVENVTKLGPTNLNKLEQGVANAVAKGTTNPALGPSNYFDLETSGTGPVPAGAIQRYFYLKIGPDDVASVAPPAQSSKVEGFVLDHSFGGSSTQGGRNSFATYLTMVAPTNSGNVDRNYVAVQAVFDAASSDGGTPGVTWKGAGFALSTLTRMQAAAVGFLNASAGDFELVVDPGAGSLIQACLQVGGSIGGNGTLVDAGIWMSCGGTWGFTPVGYLTGIHIGAEGGSPMLAPTGTIMKVAGHPTLAAAFDFQTTVFSGFLLASNGFQIIATNSDQTIQLGRVGGTSATYIDFHPNGTAGVYDVRLQGTGGDGTTGHGTLHVGGQFQIDSVLASATSFIINAPTGQTGNLTTWMVNAAPKLSVLPDGRLSTTSGNEATGAGSALLGANSPATTLTAPYKWIKFATSDGSMVYVPAWK